jgi:hypothetical protein
MGKMLKKEKKNQTPWMGKKNRKWAWTLEM